VRSHKVLQMQNHLVCSSVISWQCGEASMESTRGWQGLFASTHQRGETRVTGARQELLLPSFNYYLDESDPDIVILRRQDDSFVAAFSAMGVTREGIVEVAREDYRQLIQSNLTTLRQATKDDRSA
jgi:hypothetical protein